MDDTISQDRAYMLVARIYLHITRDAGAKLRAVACGTG
jgi:hypothetical protein